MWRNLKELYQYRGLLLSLVQRELQARYRGSVLGFLWTFLNPTLLMLVYGLVFSVYMRQSIPNYLYFMFVGLLPWIWFSSSVASGASSVSDRRDLLTKVRFPAQVLPATVVSTNLINFVLSLPLMFILGAVHGVWPTWHVIALPVIILIQLCLTLGLEARLRSGAFLAFTLFLHGPLLGYPCGLLLCRNPCRFLFGQFGFSGALAATGTEHCHQQSTQQHAAAKAAQWSLLLRAEIYAHNWLLYL